MSRIQVTGSFSISPAARIWYENLVAFPYDFAVREEKFWRFGTNGRKTERKTPAPVRNGGTNSDLGGCQASVACQLGLSSDKSMDKTPS